MIKLPLAAIIPIETDHNLITEKNVSFYVYVFRIFVYFQPNQFQKMPSIDRLSNRYINNIREV